METLNPWLLLIAGLLVGALLGGIGILFMERRNRGSAEDVRAARRELEEYRQEVAEHYVETAKRVNALTHSYKSVYDHLEDGAYRLVGEEELRRRLDDRGAEPVMLEGIGQRSLQRPGDDADRETGDAATHDATRRDLGTAATYGAARHDTRDERERERVRDDDSVATDVLPSTGTAAGHVGTSGSHVAAYPTVNDSVTDDVAEERAAARSDSAEAEVTTRSGPPSQPDSAAAAGETGGPATTADGDEAGDRADALDEVRRG